MAAGRRRTIPHRLLTHTVPIDPPSHPSLQQRATDRHTLPPVALHRYIILDKDEPTKIIQRGSGQFMVPTYDYETLCKHRVCVCARARVCVCVCVCVCALLCYGLTLRCCVRLGASVRKTVLL